MSVNVNSATWRYRTGTGIPYKVISRSGSFSDEESVASEVYIIRAYELIAFAFESFPPPWVVNNRLYYPPCRGLPGFGLMRTKRVSWKALIDDKPCDPFGVDPGSPDNTYDPNIEVTIEYSTSKSDEESEQNPETFVEVSASAAGQVISTPTRGKAKWANGDEVREIDIPRTIIEPETEWSVRWPRIPANYCNDTLLNRLRGAMGKVNSDTMSMLGNAPPATILFMGFSSKDQLTWQQSNRDGSIRIERPPVELEMKFLERSFKDVDGDTVTWQMVYRPGVGYRTMKIDGDPLYASTDLSGIFS